MIEFQWQPIGGWAGTLALVLVLVALLRYGPARSKTTRRQRRALTALRALAVLCTGFALVRPAAVFSLQKRQSASLVLLVDTSRSMQVVDGAGQRSRWQEMQDALQASTDTLAQLAQVFDVRTLAFDVETRDIACDQGHLELPDQPLGSQTALGATLDEVLRREAGRRVAGVIVLTDGAQRAVPARDTPPQIAADRMAENGTPLFPIVLGQPRAVGETRDWSVDDLELSSQVVFVKNELTATATVRVDGYLNQPVPLELWFETSPGNMTLVAGGAITADHNSQRLIVERGYVPPTPGEFKLTVRIPPQPGELVTTNNELSTFVTVRGGGINVLYVEGDLQRVEKRFLRAALDGSPNIQVYYDYLDAQQADARPNDLASSLTPGRYDVFLWGDVDASAFSQEELASLAQCVQQGAGLVMLGGFHSFGPGGYQQTALAELLPVEMGPFERQPFGDPISPDLHLTTDLALHPTTLGLRHFVMLLASPDQNAAVWNSLPPLSGANRFRGLKPRANLLAQGTGGEPLLVAQDVGAGRVLAFAGDSTWRWVLAGHAAEHQRFWRQTVLWLAHREAATEGEVWIELDPRRYAPGRRVEFRSGVRSPEGVPLAQSEVSGEITLPDGTRKPLAWQRQSGSFSGAWSETLAPGDYALTVTGTAGGQTMGTARTRFLVHETDLELGNPAADHDLLASLAKATGGRVTPPEQLAELLDEFRRHPPAMQVQSEVRHTLWDTWPFFGVFCAVLTTEWYLRKRWGLV